MIPYIQTKFTDVDQTVHGNCLRTCLASILEVDPDSLPFWEDMGRQWFPSFHRWLKEHDLEYEGMCYHTQPQWAQELLEYEGIDGYVIGGGRSPRAHVTRGHAVIYKSGIMVHDPHPSGAGLLELEDIYYIRRMTPEEKISYENYKANSGQ